MSIPPDLRAAGNATLLFLCTFAILFFGGYILRAWAEAHRKFRAFHNYENKAAVASFTFFSGLWLRLMQTQIAFFSEALAAAVYIIGTLIAAWGMICLLRALARYTWPKCLWASIALASLVFGVLYGMH